MVFNHLIGVRFPVGPPLNNMFKIAIVEKIDESGLKLLEKHPDFEFDVIENISKENLIKELPKFDGLTLRVANLDSEILINCKKLKVISRHGVGYDNIDLNYIKKNKITLLITANANAVAVAEHAINLMFSVNRKLDQQITSVKNGKWMDDVKGDLEEFHTLVDKRIGIIGLGRIGSRVAKRLRGWECELVYYDNLDFETNYIKDSGAKYLELHELLETSDIITIHVPLDRTTKHMISKEEFRLMKKTAIFINTCRGPVVDEKAMIEALLNNEIFAAGLDVTEIEPIENNNPLLKMENVIITPHLATKAIESQKNAYENSLKNASKVLNGNIADSIVKPV